MSKGKGPWRDGRRAWERLAGWCPDNSSEPPDSERDPLAALSDIGLMRRLLDETELEAVRSARRRRRSWAEIAIKLGVSRQSAWERWRDLDVEPAEPERVDRPVDALLDDGSEASMRAAVLGREARSARRRALVTVPHVVGMSLDDARRLLAERGLVAVSSDPDDLPAALLGLRNDVVSDQSPESGAKAPPGAPVRLWTERGGGSGVREPRRPRPTPRTEHEAHEEPSEEAVG